jgi:IstB-like ATP binding protein
MEHNNQENVNDIGTLPAREALSALLSKCKSCGQRSPMQRRDWCRPCALKWQREHGKEGSRYRGWVDDCCPDWRSEIPERYSNATLADLAEPLVERYLALPTDKGLLLWGTPGVGKTHAMCAFAKNLWTEGWEFRRITYERLCLDIRATYDGGAGTSERTIMEPFWTVPKLFIEDVGVTVSLGQQESDFSLRTFTTLLDRRLEQCRATFITSNKSLEELAESFDVRVASRLCEACDIVRVMGVDRRRQGTHSAAYGTDSSGKQC